ncbi:PGG domain containing protein [Parasponia andersonii]|uniref:PGG domain containing protein n=1 Tax=Parasponia andersonii TaxID=3476 RepID=A0A2P5DD45_PARAD|nr:PGG domain containing protein [Parasponia andersonii]
MLLRRFCEVIQTLNKEQISNGLIGQALCESVTRGTLEFFLSVTKAKPELISYLDDSGKDIFMLAVQFRQPKIYCLIHGINASEKARAVSLADDSENSILDMAGFLAPSTQLNSIQGAALQMQRELQWFKEVESIVPPQHIDGKNAELMTARESFTKNHADLMIAGEKWMKDIAGSCSVVSSLIVTIMFAVAFAVPGGYNQNTGFPMFLEKKWFKIFIISDAISLFSSTASVLMFLGILTSRYAENDFLKSLPTKLMIGLSTLFFSIATMTLAFVAAIFIMLRDELQIIIPILLLASLPVALFVWMQFPLLIRIFNSTYGPSIFDRKIKRWF